MAYFENVVFQSERTGLRVIVRKHLETIISQAQRYHNFSSEEDPPLGICVVFGDNKDKRKSCTDLLLSYYEEKENPGNENAIRGVNGEPKFVPDRMAQSEGVYLWSKLYKTSKKSQDFVEYNLVLILYVEGENIKFDEVAANLCSQAIILDTKEEKWLEKVLLHDGNPSSPVKVITCLNRNVLGYKQGQVCSELIDNLETDLVPTKIVSGKVLRLNDMISFVEKTVQLLNDKTTTINYTPSNEKLNENMDQPISNNETCHFSRAGARDRDASTKSTFQNQIIISDGSISVKENIIEQQQMSQDELMLNTSLKSELDLSSKTFQYTLLASLNKWLDSQTSLFSTDSLFKYLKSFESYDILNELDETV